MLAKLVASAKNFPPDPLFNSFGSYLCHSDPEPPILEPCNCWIFIFCLLIASSNSSALAVTSFIFCFAVANSISAVFFASSNNSTLAFTFSSRAWTN